MTPLYHRTGVSHDKDSWWLDKWSKHISCPICGFIHSGMSMEFKAGELKCRGCGKRSEVELVE